MSLSEETTNVLYKNTIKYLHDLAEKVPNTQNVLKSFYAAKFRISALQTKIHVENNKNKSDARCSRCCLKFRETDASYVVKPQPKKSGFARKVLKKVRVNRRLTKFQAKYLKENDRILKPGNRLVVTCNFCKKEVIYTCTKPKKERIVANSKPLLNHNKNKRKAKKKEDKFCGLHKDADHNQKKRKPKKKKDKFCGLHKDAVASVQNRLPKALQDDIVQIGVKAQDDINRVLNNGISKKQKKKQKKHMNTLANMLDKNRSFKPKKNNLEQFLQSLNI